VKKNAKKMEKEKLTIKENEKKPRRKIEDSMWNIVTEMLFALSLISFMFSLIIPLVEIQLSTKALELELSTLASLGGLINKKFRKQSFKSELRSHDVILSHTTLADDEFNIKFS